jgi:hypothetical protein
MHKRHPFAFWSLSGVGFLCVLYVVSFYIFMRSHITSGIPYAGGFTTVYWSLKDTPTNRALMEFYKPFRSLRMFDLTIVWS